MTDFNPTGGSGGGGGVVAQYKRATSTTSSHNLGTSFTSTPTMAQGIELVTLSVTPTAVGNKIHILTQTPFNTWSNQSEPSNVCAVLGHDSESDPLAAKIIYAPHGDAVAGGGQGCVYIDYEFTTTDTVAVTFKVRGGTVAASNTVNVGSQQNMFNYIYNSITAVEYTV